MLEGSILKVLQLWSFLLIIILCMDFSFLRYALWSQKSPHDQGKAKIGVRSTVIYYEVSGRLTVKAKSRGLKGHFSVKG